MSGRRPGRAWIELDLGALERNVAALRRWLPEGCRLMPALKANAYGHGALPIAAALNRMGVDAFCVATAEEGARLRRGGIRGQILVLGYTDPADFPLLRRFRLSQTVVDGAYARRLAAWGRPVSVHIKVDTGMHRLGLVPRELETLLWVLDQRTLRVEGLYTHLCADDSDAPAAREMTERQIAAFQNLRAVLTLAGRPLPPVHILSSYGLCRHPWVGGDYARVGIALYGMLSRREDSRFLPEPLAPVLSLKARVASLRWLRPGESAGYGPSFTAGRPTLCAALSIGYADGLDRRLSQGRGQVLLGGRRCPILGRVCMDQVLADATAVPWLAQGDEAVFIGRSGAEEITACDVAAQCGTIANEVLSRLGSRLERVVLRGPDEKETHRRRSSL